MSDRDIQNMTPDFDDYSLDELLEDVQSTSASGSAPFSAPDVPTNGSAPESAGEIAERSRRAVMEALGDTLRQYQEARRSSPPDTQPQEAEAPAATGVLDDEDVGGMPLPARDDTDGPEAPDGTKAAPGAGEGNDDIDPFPLPQKPPAEDRAADGDADAEEEPYEEDEAPAGARDVRGVDNTRSFADRFLTPVIRLIATRIARTQMQHAEAENWPDPVEIRETPELSPGKAGKYYASMLRTLRLRLRIATFLTLILAWISLKLPMAGMLRASLPLQAGTSLILTLAVMMAALDVFSTGIRQFFDLKPAAESLASAAAILSCIDGALVLFGIGDSLPFCAIGAAALTAALWGERLTCTALRRTFKTASSSKKPSALASETRGSGKVKILTRSHRGTSEGIVRRSESQDLCQTVYAAAAPFLLGGALLLAVIASLGGGHFLHTLSALVSVSASFAAFFSFPLPYAIATRKLRHSGAALAGYAGCADIGKTRRIIITDEDLFPPGTMRFSEINVLEGVFLGKVVSCTASLIDASGSGVSTLFADLVARRGYHVPGVVDFVCHEGGGLSGLIGGERILVGSAGFMNLMGIRLPQNLPTKNAICTAISGELVGVFVIDYIPVTSVQEALVTLLRSRMQTIFAIRDFNITPRMISQLFLMPTDNFNFPSFRERYRIGTIGDDSTPIDAVVTRSGMLPLVEAAETGRRVYNTCRISTILSLTGTIIGMIIMFLLCRAGSFDTATAGNVLSFMLLWTLPVVILSIGQIRQ